MPDRGRRGPLPLLYPPCNSGGYGLVHHEVCPSPVPARSRPWHRPTRSQFVRLQQRTHCPNRSVAAPAWAHERRNRRG